MLTKKKIWERVEHQSRSIQDIGLKVDLLLNYFDLKVWGVGTKNIRLGNRFLQDFEELYEEDTQNLIERVRVMERVAIWNEINKYIRPGDLGGNGTDQNAERNGLILAANLVKQRGENVCR